MTTSKRKYTKSNQQQSEKSIKLSELMGLSLQALSVTYEGDPSYPSLTCSYLAKEGMYYASVIRYHAKWAEQKQVVFSAKSDNLITAIKTVMQSVINRQEILQKAAEALR